MTENREELGGICEERTEGSTVANPAESDVSNSVDSGGGCFPTPLFLIGGVESTLQQRNPSNTADDVKEGEILTSGIDTCDLGLYIDWGWSNWEEVEKRLEKEKERARENRNPVKIDLDIDTTVEMFPGVGAQKRYNYHIRIPSGNILLLRRDSPDGHTPNMIFQPLAKWLWTDGIYSAMEDCQQFINLLGGRFVGRGYHINRLAVAVDVLYDRPFRVTDLGNSDRWSIPYKQSFKTFAKPSGEIETLYIGEETTSPESLKIYDKLAECEAHDQWHFLDIWGRRDVLTRNKWVYRTEWTYKRQLLKKWGLNTVEDLLHPECTGNDWLSPLAQSLLLESFGKSARFTIGNHSRKCRRENHPVWEQLSDVVCKEPGEKPDMQKKVYKPCASHVYFEKMLEPFYMWCAKYSEENDIPEAPFQIMWERFLEEAKSCGTVLSFEKHVQERRKLFARKRATWEAYQLDHLTDDYGNRRRPEKKITPEQAEIPF